MYYQLLIISFAYFAYIYCTPTQNIHASKRNGRFEANWYSLDKRILPTWYDQAKFGIFVHWGLYSVPAFGTSDHVTGYAEWFMHEWLVNKSPPFVEFMRKNYPPGFTYGDFAKLWRAEKFNASEWAEIVETSGAKYFVMTTKHHDGFCLWPTATSKNWNAFDVGPRMDIIGALRDAFHQKPDIHFGLYYSLFEWFNNLYENDKMNNFTTNEYVKKIMIPQIQEIVWKYNPKYIWSDGDWDTSYEYWQSEKILGWLYNDSPSAHEVLVNDRWGIGTACKHGDIKTCGVDRFDPHAVQAFKWEDAMTIDKHSWGYRKDASEDDYYTTKELIYLLIDTVSNGGNILMNIGPAADGTIPNVFKERLFDIGQWLKVNGEAIYETIPWRIQREEFVRYTCKGEIVYAILLQWPGDNILELNIPRPNANTQVFLFGQNLLVPWQPISPNGIRLFLNTVDKVFIELNVAWVFKLTYIE